MANIAHAGFRSDAIDSQFECNPLLCFQFARLRYSRVLPCVKIVPGDSAFVLLYCYLN